VRIRRGPATVIGERTSLATAASWKARRAAIREPGHSRRRILRTGTVYPERADESMSRRFSAPPEPSTADLTAVLADIAQINAYFAVGTGPVDNGWCSVHQLYTDRDLLGGIVERVQARLDAAEPRVAASIFFLGFAARLWSIGIGAVAGHRLLPALDADELLFREFGGQIALHIARPTAWRGDDLESRLADAVLDAHLTPLSTALHQLTNVSPELLRGNAASALLGAAREYDRHRAGASPGPGWQLAHRLCADERLVNTICFNDDDYRRSSCCLYYRTPRGGLCGDCVFTQIPGTVGRKDAS
jgi:iron complex transport system ATP-binding protein